MMIRILDSVIGWMIILIPFSMAIAPAPVNVFSGILIFCFIIKKAVNRQRFFLDTPINLPFLFLFIASAVSIFNSIDHQDSFRGLFRLIHYLFVFLIIAEEIKDKKQIWGILFSAAAGLSLVSFDAVWQVSTGKDFIRGNSPILNIGLNRATASFPDANLLGIYLSALIPLPVTLALYYLKKRGKAAMLLVSALAAVGLLLTYSRPTLLALYVVLLVLGIVKKDKLLTSALIILTIASPFIVPKSVKVLAKQVDYNFVRFMCNDDRIAIYLNSFNMIKAHPVIGVGVNTFMENYRKYKQNPEYRNVITSDYIYAHNNFIHMAGEIGFLGLGVFLWLIYALFKECARVYKRISDDFLKNVSLSLILCLSAFLVNGLTESSLYYSRVVMIFWYLVGCALALNKFVLNNESRTS